MTKKQKERENRYRELLGRRLWNIERLAEINREIKQIETERKYEDKLKTILRKRLF